MQFVSVDSMKWVTLDADLPNSTTTLANITGLTCICRSGVRYGFRFVIPYSSAAATTGVRFVLAASVGVTRLHGTSRYPVTATTETVNYFSALNTPAGANANTLAEGGVAVIEGMVQLSAAGSIFPAFASELGGSAVTVRKGAQGYVVPLQPN